MSQPERVTQNPGANEQLLYFTSSSVTSDDERIFFLSDRAGPPNVFVRHLASGREQQLTDNREGWLKSYVYFDGTPYAGLGKASLSLHAPSGTLYYIQGREICRVDPDGQRTVLAQYPEGQMTAFTHVSSDNRLLCVPTTDARALDDQTRFPGKPPYNIDERVRNEGLSSYLRVFDTRTGREVLCEKLAHCWITHVQFSPVDNNLILYNHEWASDCGIRRMWLFDGRRHLRLRPEGPGTSRRDWACHEMWERDGSAIIYHGGFAQGPNFIGRVRPDGSGRTEIPLPFNGNRYGHFTVGIPGVLVSDGYYESKGDPEHWAGQWICRVDVDWAKGQCQWTPLCRSGSSWDSQDAHPHPIIDHASRYVYFTSDADGRRAVYRVPLAPPATGALPGGG